MRVICGFTALHPRAAAALSAHAPQAEYFELGPQADAYWQLLSTLWQEGQAFLNVEQDNEIHGEVVADLEKCEEPWCLYPYPGDAPRSGEGDRLLYGALGCTRFAAVLMERHPDLMTNLPVRNWQRLDCHILPALRALGYEQHIHNPPVIHHHVYALGGCACGDEECTP